MAANSSVSISAFGCSIPFSFWIHSISRKSSLPSRNSSITRPSTLHRRRVRGPSYRANSTPPFARERKPSAHLNNAASVVSDRPLPLVNWFCPRTLSDLFEVFPRLDRSEHIALTAPESNHDPSAIESFASPSRSCPTAGSTSDEPSRDKRGGASLGVCSSGSTGRPKLVWRDWLELRAETSQAKRLHGWTWASPFAPQTFAGVQVALQAWFNGGRVISLNSFSSDTWKTLDQERVDALSATPTFMDLLLQNEDAPRSAWQSRQITLGGEPLRAQVGSRLVARFPHSRFTVIYATAELGVLLKTHSLDGWYEVNSLARRFPRWRVNEGALEIWHCERWAVTGDRVELNGDRMRVLGRADAIANVGGVKVNLADVAELAEQVPGVRRAVAVAEASPITGQIVALRYAIDPAFAASAVTQSLETHLRAKLGKEAWPRRWEIDPVAPAGNAKRAVR